MLEWKLRRVSMEKMTLEGLTQIARVSSAGEELTEGNVIPPTATIKEVRARAADAKKILERAMKAADEAVEFLDKHDVGSSVLAPKSVNKLHHVAADLRGMVDMADNVAKRWPAFRAR